MNPTRTSCRRATRLAPVLIALLLVAACGDDDTSSDEEPTTTKAVATATTEASGDKVDAGGGDESDTEPWARTAGPYRGDIGETVDFECPPDGTAHSVWGTNEYTDDSSVCTAAVHMGLIDFEEGGDVTIEITEGRDEYLGSEFDGVTSSSYAAWGGSFRFPDATDREVAATIPWDRPGNFYADRAGESITVECAPDGEARSVWGTDTYTDDSSICTAGVHAGAITLAEGGELTIRLVAGEESYEGSEANGITSQDYGPWSASFVIEG